MYPSKMGPTLKGKNLLLWEQIFSFKCRPSTEKGGKNENDRVASPESVTIHLSNIYVPDIYYSAGILTPTEAELSLVSGARVGGGGGARL